MKTAALCSLFLVMMCLAGDYPKSVIAYKGTTPVLDGILSPGEWEDADSITHDQTWNSDAGKVSDPSDFSMTAWIKHDGQYLYFAFDVTDDVIYGTDVEAWTHENNPNAHELTPEGWPWFADGIEIFLNPENEWNNTDKKNTKGDGTSWKIVCSTYKSRLGGVGVPGLLEGEPRKSSYAWNNYQQWILDGAQQAAVRIKDEFEGSGYVIEWKINADPCLEISSDTFWNGSMGAVDLGLNIEIQDLDTKEAGQGNWSNFHHIDYWAAEQGKKELLQRWGTLTLSPESKPETGIQQSVASPIFTFSLYPNYPNPFNPSTTIAFDLHQPENVRLDIFNTAGARVTTLWNSPLNPGHHTFTWEGTDVLGTAMPSGTYLLRIVAGHSVAFHKMILLR